jgi:hypothetical protein
VKAAPRSFSLDIQPEGAGYSLDLVVTSNGHQETLTHLEGGHLDRLRPSVIDAVVDSKLPRTVLSPTRRVPIHLTEEAGLKLALTALALRPISKARRIEEIRHGIDAMTSEETLYWFANCTGTRAEQALQAMRILLSKE